MPKYSNASSRINLDVGFNVDKSSLEGVKRSLQELQKLNIGSFSGPQKDLLKIKDQAKKVETALTNAFNVKLNSVNLERFNAELVKQKTSIAQIQAAFAKAGTAGQTAFNRLATSILTTNLQLKETHSLIQNFGTTMLNTIKWGFASSIINNFTGSIQQAVSYVEGLDKSLTNIRIVTGDSREEMAKFAEEANRASQSLGRSTMDYTKAALSYYQQGLSDEQVAARTEATLKAQNITGAGDEMADYLTAVWNGYRVANEEAELYVDKMAAVADSSASNMAQLATAMSKVASTADMMGVPMDSLNAQIATIVATTRQAPESVGNALKTIYTRVADIKTGSQDAQISLGNYSSKMKEVGIDVLDSSGRFRDLGDIIEQIGSKWDGLSKEQQIYLARTMAGQRQINNLLALFNNWDRYSDLVTTSMQSQGTTMEKNARYMESLAAHLEQLNAAQQRFKSAMIDSDSFKGLVDFGTGAVTVFANLIEAIGGGGTAILGLGGIFTNVFGGIISRQISNVVNHFQILRSNAEQLKQDITFTQQFGHLSGVSGEAVRSMVQLKQAAQQYYHVLSHQQINSYQNMVREVGQLQTQIEQYRNLEKVALAAQARMLKGQNYGFDNKTFYQFEQLQNYLANDFKINIQDETASQTIERLKNKIFELRTTLGDDFFSKLTTSSGLSAKEIEKNFAEDEKGAQRLKLRFQELIAEILNINPDKIREYGQKANEAEAKVNNLRSATKQFLEEAKRLDTIQSFVKLTGGIMSITSAISMTVNAFKALKNESLSAGEKALQVIMGLASAAGMAVNAYTQLAPVMIKVIGAIASENGLKLGGITISTASTVAKTTETGATLGLAGATQVLTGATIELETAILPLLPVLAGIGAAVAGIVIISKLLYNAWTADSRAARQAAQTAKSVSQEYDKVKQSAEDLKSAFDNYNSIQDTLSSLTRGTKQWNEIIRQSNDLVLDLITKFPDLAKQVQNVNGQLILSDQVQEKALNKINDTADNLRLASIATAGMSREASFRAQAREVARQTQTTATIQSSGIYGGEKTTTTIGTRQATVDEVIKVIEAYSENFSGNTEQMISAIHDQTGVSKDTISAIINNTDNIKQLADETAANTEATKLAYETMAQEKLQDESFYKALSDTDRQTIDEVSGALLEANYKDILQELEDRTINRFTQASQIEDILDRYNQATGQDAIFGSNAVTKGGKINLIIDGQSVTYSKQQIAAQIAAAQALQNLGASAEQTASMLSEIDKTFRAGDDTTTSDAIKNFISGEGFGDLTAQDLNNLGNIDITSIYNSYKQQFKALGYESAEQFNTAFSQAVQSDKTKFEVIGKNYLKSVRDSFKNFKDKDLTLNASQAIADNLNQAFIHGGEQGLKNLQETLSSLSPDELQNVADILANIDWTQDGAAYQLKEALEDQGIVLNENTPGWNSFIELLDKSSSKAQDAAGSIEKLRSVISQLKDLSAGDVLDDTAYNELIAIKPELESLFKLSDQGYMFIGTQQQITESIKNTTQETINNLKQIESVANQIKEDNLGSVASGINLGQGYTASKETQQQINELSQEEAFHNAMTVLGLSQEGFQEAQRTIQEYSNKRRLSEDAKAQYDEAKQVIQTALDQISNMQSQVQSGAYQQQMKQTQSIIATQAQSLEELRNSYYERQILLEDYADMRQMLLEKQIEQLGITREQYDATYQQLQDHLEKTSESFEQLSEAQQQVQLDQLTQRIYELGQSLDQLQGISQDTFDNIQEFISKGLSDTPQFATQVGELQTILEEIFQTDIDPSFIAQNFDLIRQLAQGDITALDDLQMALAQDYLAQIRAEVDPTAYGAVDQFSSWLSAYDLDDLYVGATLDDAGFTEMLGILAAQAGLTADDINNILAGIGFEPEVIQQEIPFNQINKSEHGNDYSYTWTDPVTGQTQQIFLTTDQYDAAQSAGKVTIPIINGKKIKYTGGSKAGNYSRPNYSAPKKSGGNKKGSGGGKSSTPKAATQAKLNTSKIETKAKTAQTNPYQQQQKAFQRQEKILDNLQNKQKKLVNKDRLKNLKDQNKTLEQQIKILNKELDISRNAATKNSTANYAKRLKDAFGSVLKFDSDGQISDINALEKASVNTYNAAAKAAADAFEKQKAKYNDYINNTWNKYSTQEQQEANKAEKERWDQRVKNAEDAAKKAISAAQEEYKTREDLIKSYNDAWEADQKRLEQIRDLQDQIFENRIALSKITVDLSLDTGEAEREWLEFEKKFIKKIDDDDFLGQAKASVKELMSYFNSKQIQQTANQMQQLQKEIAIMQSGAMSSIYGDNLNAAKERLEELMKQQMGDLQEIQDLVNDIKDNYLDAIDDAKDKMDQQINQYERINDLIDHNVKLTELIYGDKAYETLDKYYNLMQKNNQQELDSLKRQQEYWQERMNQQVVGSDAWQQFKKNLDDTTDSLNDKLEEMIDNLSKKWQNKVDGIIEKLNNGLTGGRGLDYLDEQWDYINNYDDNFLDTVNSVMGTREVERLYKQASDDLSQNPKQQQKINKLMKQQLKILKEKNKLTEYDIERAKALLQVEQARIALEDARNSKTKMRLRRDSQGNYTYQYVADEQKLSDLQDSLAKAQNDLYNMDKQHYKQNLNDITDTWRDFLEQYVRLSQEAQNTLDEQERARIIARRDLLLEETNKLMEGLTEDNKYTLGYLNQSFFDNMQINPSQYSAEEQMRIMNQNIPQMKSNIQDLASQIVDQGGILNVTADAMKEINKTTQQYDTNVENTLEKAGASLQNISQVVDATGNALDKNIQNAEKFITANEKLIANCHSQIEEIRTLMDLLNNYLDNAMSVESLVSNLRNAYNIDQMLNKSKLTANVNIPVEDFNIDTTFSTLDQYQKYLSNMTQKEKQLSSTEIGNIWAEIQNKINSAEQGKTDLETSDLQSMFKAVQMVRNMTNALSGFSANQLEALGRNSINSLAGINTNSTLDQNVYIDASFPNVREHTEIEQAFENLVNMASMHASGYRD